MRSGVDGVGLAAVVRGADTVVGGGGCSGYPEGGNGSPSCTGFGVRVSWPDISTHCACARNRKRKSIVHVVT